MGRETERERDGQRDRGSIRDESKEKGDEIDRKRKPAHVMRESIYI